MRNILKLLKYWLRRIALRYRLLSVIKMEFNDYRSIMVVAPHPDDEILGLGGYIINKIRSGRRITIVYLTDGEKACKILILLLLPCREKL
jgi:hypothetical protein